MIQIPHPEESNKFAELENEGKGKKAEEERDLEVWDTPSKSGEEGKDSCGKGGNKETSPQPKKPI